MATLPITMSARPLESLLQAIASGDAIARGCVNVIGFESIRRNLGARWPNRREAIWQHISKTLESRLSPADTAERIGEVEFLVFVAVESGAVAQTVCLRALQEILSHYLGTFELADLTIMTVTGVNGSALSCVNLDPSTVLRATDTSASARAGPIADAEKKGASIAQSFMSEVRGHGLHFQLEDITSLRHNALAGGRIRRVVTPSGATQALSRTELALLDTPTLAAIDVQTAMFAASLLQGDSSYAYPSLVMPAALQTFGHSTSRANYLATLRPLGAEQRRRLIVELINLDVGTPSSRVTEAMTNLRGYCRGFSALTDPSPRTLAALRGRNLISIVVNASDLAAPGASLESPISRFADAGRRVAPITGIRGELLPSELDAARDAQITYVINPVERVRPFRSAA